MHRLLAPLALFIAPAAMAGGLQSATIVLDDGHCMAVSGSQLTAEVCGTSIAQQWIRHDSGQLQSTRKLVYGGLERCVTASSGGSVALTDCDDADDNQVFVHITSEAGEEYLNVGTATWLNADNVGSANSEWDLTITSTVN